MVQAVYQAPRARSGMLTASDLEVNVLAFRQRSFQFERLADLADGPWAVFSRTETENERQLRPRLVRLTVAAPLAWVVLDEATDLLRFAPDGRPTPANEATPVEVAAEPSEFDEDGRRWVRRRMGDAAYLYAPAESADTLLGPRGLAGSPSA